MFTCWETSSRLFAGIQRLPAQYCSADRHFFKHFLATAGQVMFSRKATCGLADVNLKSGHSLSYLESKWVQSNLVLISSPQTAITNTTWYRAAVQSRHLSFSVMCLFSSSCCICPLQVIPDSLRYRQTFLEFGKLWVRRSLGMFDAVFFHILAFSLLFLL